MAIHLLLLLLLAWASSACSPGLAREGPAADVHALTGTHTRVVWVQHDGTDPFAMGRQLVLMGLDTDDGRGERVILKDPGSYVKPMLTPRGDRVVYSTHPGLGDASVHLVNFDGTGHRRFDRGFALAVWQDPSDGGEWIYIGSDNREFAFGTITRVRLDQPSRREQVWQHGMVSLDTFQVSPDGRLAGGLFPWPDAGVADLSTGKWRRLGDGCWTALNDAGSPLFWYFDGSHRNLLMVDLTRDRRWTVPINRAPGFANPEVYHPRWTPHPRFMTLSGPYDQGGANQVRSGGNQSEIWIGRFSDDFTRIEAWARATHNARADSYPDVWIDRSSCPYPSRASGRIGPGAANEQATADRSVVEARLVSSAPIPTPESIAPYRHALVVSRYEVVNTVEGPGAARELLVAHWAIRDGRVLSDAARAAGQVYRLTVERYDAHPELEGERLIQEATVAAGPLYYDVGTNARFTR
ncbi:MAG: hypothetical protein ACT4QD_13370 [Acidobacteriota bacterium]